MPKQVASTRVFNMTNAEGKRFQCEIPGELPAGGKLLTQRALRRRRTIPLPDIRTTTRNLFGTCKTWGEGQYWQYELCHGKAVTQFHQPTVRAHHSPPTLLTALLTPLSCVPAVLGTGTNQRVRPLW